MINRQIIPVTLGGIRKKKRHFLVDAAPNVSVKLGLFFFGGPCTPIPCQYLSNLSLMFLQRNAMIQQVIQETLRKLQVAS